MGFFANWLAVERGLNHRRSLGATPPKTQRFFAAPMAAGRWCFCNSSVTRLPICICWKRQIWNVGPCVTGGEAVCAENIREHWVDASRDFSFGGMLGRGAGQLRVAFGWIVAESQAGWGWADCCVVVAGAGMGLVGTAMCLRIASVNAYASVWSSRRRTHSQR